MLLKDFIAINTDGDLSRLVISGKFSLEEITERWESIIEEHSKHSDEQRFESYQRLLQSYSKLMAEHTIVSACLMIMTVQDAALCWEEVTEVIERGYEINLNSGEAYVKSILNAKRKVSHLMTNCVRKQKEMERRFGRKDHKETKANIYDIVGSLEISLGFALNIDTLTLSHYNALKKGINQKEAARQAASARQKGKGRNTTSTE